MAPENSSGSVFSDVAILAAIVSAYFALKYPYLVLPLIRDEGEYALMGQRILQGDVPYLDLYNQKTPLTFYYFALVQWVLGPSIQVFRAATVLYGGLTTVAVFYATRNLFGRPAAIAAACAINLLFYACCAYFQQTCLEYFVLLWYALALYYWYQHDPPRSIKQALLAGIMAGLAYQTKQNGLVLLGFLWVEPFWVWLRRGPRTVPSLGHAGRDAACATLGFGIVLAATLAVFALQGGMAAYIECTWTNNLQYVGHRQWDKRLIEATWHTVVVNHIRWTGIFWILGTLTLLASEFLRSRRSTVHGLWILLAGTIVMALNGRQNYIQYFIPILLPVAIGLGALLGWLATAAMSRQRSIGLRIGYGLVGASLCLSLLWLDVRIAWDNRLWRARVIAAYPFDEAMAVAGYLHRNTNPGETILIVGSEPEIYYYANRRPASRMNFSYPMTGPYAYAEGLREEFFSDWEKEKPHYVIFVRDSGSITEFSKEGRKLLRPAMEIIRRDYELEVGMLDQLLPLNSEEMIQRSSMLICRRRLSAK